MNTRQWLELPMFRTNVHGPKDGRVIAVWLYCMYVLVSILRYDSNKHAKFALKNIFWISCPLQLSGCVRDCINFVAFTVHLVSKLFVFAISQQT